MKDISEMLSFTTFLMFRKSLTRTLSLILVLGMILACIVLTTTAMAATEAEKLAAIEYGLAHLASIQQLGGYWNYGGYEQAVTGAAAFTFLSQKDKWGANAVQYQTAVDNAISFLLNSATITTVGVRDDGYNPCGTGTCTGVYWYGAGETTYTTGLVAPAIALYGASNPNAVATTSGPLANMTWKQIAQGITNLFAASQTTATYGNRRGGWRYYPGEGDSDMSTTQWAVISILYDQTLGAATPQFVKDEMKYWLAAVQVNGQGGAACYQPDYLLCDHSDTGGLLLSLILVGDTLSDPAVQAALGFLNTNWTQTANTWYGNFGHPYAMWSVYKGLETTIGLKNNTYITNLLTTCGAPNNLPGNPPGSVPCNWWEDYNEWLVRNQNLDGSWTGYWYWTDPLSTAFIINILGATPIPPPTCGDSTCNGTETCSTCPQDCGVCPCGDGTCNIQVILPIGGEILPSGQTSRNYGICWQAPSNAVKFDLYYSLNNGTSWNFIKTVTGLNCTHWPIPIVTVNKKECRVKVIGYDSEDALVGQGISAKPFTIEVLRVLTPNGGETLTSGSTWAIKWKTNETIRPVAKVKLFYTTGVGSWPLIKTVTGSPGTYNWKVPAASSTKCKVKVILKDESGTNVGTDISDRIFTIQP